MIRVYGCSDDLVEIEGAKYPNDEVGCYEKDVRIEFEDGSVIRVGYPKDGLAVWWIKYEHIGTARADFDECVDEDADIYSDIFYIDSKVKKVDVIDKEIVRYPDVEKVRTKRDMLRAMTDERLADFINSVETAGRAYGPRGRASWLKWLREEDKEG